MLLIFQWKILVTFLSFVRPFFTTKLFAPPAHNSSICSNKMLALKCQMSNLFTYKSRVKFTWSNSGEIEISFKFCVQFTPLLFSITVTVFIEILTLSCTLLAYKYSCRSLLPWWWFTKMFTYKSGDHGF